MLITMFVLPFRLDQAIAPAKNVATDSADATLTWRTV